MAKFTRLIELKAADKISAAFDRISRKLRPLTKGVRRAAFSFDQLQKRTAKLRKSLSKTGKAMRNVGRDMSMRMTLPILGFGAAALFATSNFEKSMNKVEALTGATADEMASMTAMARELGKTTQFSAKEAADGMSFLGMAGFERQYLQ